MNRRIRAAAVALVALAVAGCSADTDAPVTTNASIPASVSPLTATPGSASGSGSVSPQDLGSPPAPEIDEPSTSTGSSTDQGTGDSHAAYLTAADAACDIAGHQLAAIAPASGPAELVATLKSQLQVQQDLLTALGRLTPAAADRAEITANLIDPYQQAIAAQQALLPAIESAVSSVGDTVQLASLHTDYHTAGHPRSVAVFVRDHGFQTCQTFDYFRDR